MKLIATWTAALLLLIVLSYIGNTSEDQTFDPPQDYPQIRLTNAVDWCQQHNRNHQCIHNALAALRAASH